MSSPVPDMQNIDISRQSGLGLGGRLMSNAALLGGSKALAAIMGIATLIITAKALNNNAAFGTLLFIHTYMLFFSELTSFKTWQAIIRFGSDEVANENPRRLAQLFKTGLITDAAAALIAFLIAITSFELYNWLSGLIPNDGKADILDLPDGWSLKTLIIGYCSVILFRQVDVSIGIFRLFDKFSILAFRALVMPSVRLVGALIVWHQGWGFIGFLAVWYLASFLGYIVLIGFGGFEILKRGLWPLIKSETLCRKSNFPELYPFLIKANIDATLKTFKKNFPSLAVMLLLGPVALAVYKIADEISRILSRAISLFDQVLFPELSRMASEVDFKTLKRTTLKTALGIGIAGLFFSGIMLIFGEKIIALAFEDTFTDASTLSVMLLIASSLIGIALPFYTVFYVLTRPGVAIWVRLLGVVLFIIILFALAKPYGLYAIGWAAIIAAAVELICVFGLANRFIKLSKKQA